MTATGVGADGGVRVSRPDLLSGEFGTPWGQGWTWTNAAGYDDGVAGGGATQAPHLVRVNGDDSIGAVMAAGDARFFDLYGGAYHARYGGTAVLTHDGTNHLFVLTDGTGRAFTFYDFSGSTPAGREGKLKSVADAAGALTEVTSWDGAGRPTEVQRVTGSGGNALTESFVSAYVASGANAGLLESVTQRTRVGTGSWATVRTVEYTYYDGTTGPGLAGNLKTAVVKDASGNVIDTGYYRWYTTGTGQAGNLRSAFGPAAYGRLSGHWARAWTRSPTARWTTTRTRPWTTTPRAG